MTDDMKARARELMTKLEGFVMISRDYQPYLDDGIEDAIAAALRAERIAGMREAGDIALGCLRNGRTLISEIEAGLHARITELQEKM